MTEPDWLDLIEQRLHATSTPPPWRRLNHLAAETAGQDYTESSVVGDSVGWSGANVAYGLLPDDAAFIAAAPQDVARLVTEVRRLHAAQSDHVAAKYWRELQKLRAERDAQATPAP